MVVPDALKFYPEIQAQLSDIAEEGVEVPFHPDYRTVMAELTLKSAFRVSYHCMDSGPRVNG